MFRYAVDTFIELIEQVTKRRKNYQCNASDRGSFDNFLEKYPNVDKEYLRKFIEYGVQSWFNDSVKNDVSRIRFTWIFGANAIKRWNANSVSTNVRITRNCLKKKHKINLTKVNSNLSSVFNTVRLSEEKQKAECFNSKRGLDWCIANTTLFFHKSSYCIICNFRTECKEILKQQYKKIYKLRGYE